MRLDLSLPVILIAIAETLIWAALFYLFPALLLHWEASFGWSRGDIALAFTLALAIAALASPLAGRLIDSGLSRYLFPAAAALGGAALICLANVESKFGFFAVWAVVGLACSACLYEPCFAFLTRVKGTEARSAITTVTLAAGFASTLAFPLANAIAAAYGWRAAAYAFAGIAIFVAAPLFAIAAQMLERTTPAFDPVQRLNNRAAARGALRKPAFWLLATAFPALALTHGMTISHLLPVLEDRGATAASAVVAASLVGPCQVLGRIAITFFAPNRSAAAITIVAFIAIAASCSLLLFAANETAIFGAIMLFGAGYGVLSITRPLVAADFLGRTGFGAISGQLALPYIACSALAPTVAALLWGVGGYDLTISVGAALALAGAIFLRAAARAARVQGAPRSRDRPTDEIDPGEVPR